jgi:hypothetical protein
MLKMFSATARRTEPATANATTRALQLNCYMPIKARVAARTQGTWRFAALNARYIQARVTICTVNSQCVYTVNARRTLLI